MTQYRKEICPLCGAEVPAQAGVPSRLRAHDVGRAVHRSGGTRCVAAGYSADEVRSRPLWFRQRQEESEAR